MYNGKCRESLKETRRLIVEEVDHTPNAKISVISQVLARPFWLSICSMNVTMVKWSFSKVSSWNKSKTKSMN